MDDIVTDTAVDTPTEFGDSPGQLPLTKERPSATTTKTLPIKRKTWIKRIGSGIVLDVRARSPWYISDWKDAWNYRVVPATALIFFAKYVHSFTPGQGSKQGGPNDIQCFARNCFFFGSYRNNRAVWGR